MADAVRVERTADGVVVSASPGCAPVVGWLFLFVGGMFAYGLAGGFTNLHEVPLWGRVVASFMTMAVLLAGGYVLREARHHRVEVDRRAGTVTIRRSGRPVPFATSERLELSRVIDVRIAESTDDDGDPIHGIVMRTLDHGHELGLTPIFYPDRAPCEAAVAALREAIGLEPVEAPTRP